LNKNTNFESRKDAAMEQIDLIIKGGKVVNSGRTLPQWVGVDGGKIIVSGYNEEHMPETKRQ
jgi:hypothetical protein